MFTRTYPVQNHVDLAAGIDDCVFAAQLDHFAKHTDNAVLELLEVGLQNAGSLWVVHGEWCLRI